jgi:hypothetical protein
MTSDLVVVGLGQLGELLATGALRAGLRVTPVLRSTPRPLDFSAVPPETPVLLAVGEGWEKAAADVPAARRGDVVVLQNEIFPSSLVDAGLPHATVLMVWFNRKAFAPPQPGPPSQALGKHAAVMQHIHAATGLPCEVLDASRLPEVLAAKYAFIATINILGVRQEQTVGAWFQAHAPEANAVLEDVLTLAARLCDTPLTPALRQQVQHALNVHAALPARGRTSLARLQRARAHAARLGLRLNTFLGE